MNLTDEDLQVSLVNQVECVGFTYSTGTPCLPIRSLQLIRFDGVVGSTSRCLRFPRPGPGCNAEFRCRYLNNSFFFCDRSSLGRFVYVERRSRVSFWIDDVLTSLAVMLF